MKSSMRGYFGFPVLILLFSCSVFSLPAQSPQNPRGLAVLDKAGLKVGEFKASYALVIGNSQYTDWSKLQGVESDIVRVEAALKRHGFNVIVKKNLSASEMKIEFDDFINSYGFDENNRLLFYYSGHGHTLKLAGDRDMGYLVPIDTPSPLRDENGFKRKALSMQQFDTWAKNIEARHALFIFDSCFSGSIFNLSKGAPEYITNKTMQPVRQFISSGSADQTVPDRSIFCDQFLAAIDGSADLDRDGYVSGVELGEYLQKNVTLYSKNTQTPQYGKIIDQRLDKGDFVFEVGQTDTKAGMVKTSPVSSFEYKRAPNNSIEITKFIGKESEVVVPDVIDGLPVVSIGVKAFASCKHLKSVVLLEGMKLIGEYAFEFSGLEKISFPINQVTLNRAVFRHCDSLKKIDIPNGVTAIPDELFSYSGLEEITLPDTVVTIGYQAFGSTKIRRISLPSGLTTIGSWAFYDCQGLTSLSIPNSVETIGSCAFLVCKSLSSVVLPNRLKALSSGLFKDCESLESVAVPRNVVSIDADAFFGCTQIAEIYIPDNVVAINGIFPNPNLAKIEVHPNNRAFKSIDGVLFARDLLRIIQYPPRKMEDRYSIPVTVTSIGEGAFANCGNLVGIDLPKNVTFIGDAAFYGCSNLLRINIPEKVTIIGERAFASCIALTKITIPINVTTIKGWILETEHRMIRHESPFDQSTAADLSNPELAKSSTVPRVNYISRTYTYNKGAFNGCINLKYIYCRASVQPVGWGTPRHLATVPSNSGIFSYKYVSSDWNGSSAEVVWGYSGD